MQSALIINEYPTRRIAIKPSTQGNKKANYVLVFEKLSQSNDNINCTAKFQSLETFNSTDFTLLLPTPIYGCLGLVQVDNEPFICVITDCSPVGDIQGSMIYQINNVMFFSLTSKKYDDISENGASFVQQREFVSYQSSSFEATQEQIEIFKHPCAHLQRFINSGSFYFSYDFDLTRTAQVRFQSAELGSIWETANEKYFWNRYIIKELLKFRKQLPDSDQNLLDQEGILVMAISGFIRIEEINLSSDKVKTALISRMSCKRAGTRFNTRGLDDDGNAANSVETELLFFVHDLCYSQVIFRGSVPLFWEQPGLQISQHKIQFSRSPEATLPAIERHFNGLIETYGNIHAINLLSHKEGTAELQLTEAYSQEINQLNMKDMLQMTNFDFHMVVKGSQYENLVQLTNMIRGSINNFGFFLVNVRTKDILSLQKGIFRVNCLDCLDRTNVVEGLICKASLNNFVSPNLNISADNIFNVCLNDIWADNGDEISRIYTGTGALKSGFTRTGKRTIVGFMDDAKKSATRFIQNNFQDKYKQEVIDMLLGKLNNQIEIRLYNPIREAVMQQLNQRFNEYAKVSNIRVFVGTWNVNGKQPLGESLFPWIHFANNNMADMYVFGFQEMVELSPQQIMATDVSKRAIWEDLLIKILNSNSQGYNYFLLKSDQLVGAALSIFIRSEHAPNLRNVQSAIKKTGFAGLAGNKGGIAIRLDFFDTSLCFVCAHLAAGHSNFQDRNNDYHTINNNLVFAKGKKILDHDNIIWLGDFNYRINLSNEEVRSRITRNELDHLFKYDQLNQQIQSKNAFVGFIEAKIQFQPTYRFDVGTNQYDTSEKSRTPAWTDRVLVFGQSVKQLNYERAELVSSDHKPVKSLLEIGIKMINKELKDKIQKDLYKKAMEISEKKESITKITPPKESILIDFSEPAPILPVRPQLSNNWLEELGSSFSEQTISSNTPSLPPRNESFVQYPIQQAYSPAQNRQFIAQPSQQTLPNHYVGSNLAPPPIPSKPVQLSNQNFSYTSVSQTTVNGANQQTRTISHTEFDLFNQSNNQTSNPFSDQFVLKK